MYVGTLQLTLAIHGATSLKDRRRAVRSLTARVRNRFNASIADVDASPVPGAAAVAIACAGSDPRYLDGQLRAIADFIEALRLDVEVVDEQKEIVQL